jgi:transglutaminase-like putative cysteine protease
MTTVLTPPPTRAVPEPLADGPRSRRQRLAGPWRSALAVAVAVVLASWALSPLFADSSWFESPLIMITLVTATGWALVTLRVPAVLVPIGQCFVGLVVMVVGFTQNTSWAPLPTAAALNQLHIVLQDGMDDVGAYSPPVPVSTGLIALCTLGIGVVTMVTFVAVVFLRAPVLAGAPLLALYAVPAAALPDGAPWWTFVVTVLGWLVIVTTDSRLRLSAWGRVLPRTEGPVELATRTDLLGPATRLAVPALALALLVPVLVPGLTDALLGARGPGDGTGTGGASATSVGLDPLVSLRRDLQQSATQEVFTYRTTDKDPQYLRAVTLSDFDGVNWRPQVFSSQTSPPLGQANVGPGLLTSGISTSAATYIITDSKLSSPYLPLPAPITSVSVPGDWNYDPGTGVLFSTSTSTLGKTWSVNALDVNPTPDQLRAVAKTAPDDIRRSNSLQVTLPDELTSIAAQVTAGQTTEYDMALALQRYFRTEFTYSTAVAGDGSTDALLSFLRDKIGYCQQFAATMALMARSLGIPARVAVGFTAGTKDAAGDYVVTTKDAHAWPELWFTGIGWVRFEPTPRSDAGGTVNVPVYAQGSAATTTAPPPGSGSQIGPGGSIASKLRAIDHRGDSIGNGPDLTATGPTVDVADQVRRNALIVLLVVALIGAATPAVIRVRRRRRRRSGSAEGAWDELRDTVRDLGKHWADANTPRQASAWLVSRDRLDSEAAAALSRLAGDTEAARYAREPGALDRSRTQADLRTARRALRARVGFSARLRARLLPASVLHRTPPKPA